MEVGFESLILVGVFNYDLLHQSMLLAIPSCRSAEDFTHQEESNHLFLDDPITSSPLIPFTKHICIAFSFASDLLSKSWIVWSRNRAFNGKAPKPTNPDLLNGQGTSCSLHLHIQHFFLQVFDLLLNLDSLHTFLFFYTSNITDFPIRIFGDRSWTIQLAWHLAGEVGSLVAKATPGSSQLKTSDWTG